MSWLKALAAAGLLASGACAQIPLPAPGAAAVSVPRTTGEGAGLLARFRPEVPFAQGALAIVAAEEGEVDSYRLVPCQEGRAVCAGHAQGPAATLARTPGWTVVQGAYGRTFWLGQGGGGYLQQGGRYVPLAWSSRAAGTGDGENAAIETPFRHD